MDRFTCFGCERLHIYSDKMIGAMGSCGENGFIVPQNMDGVKKILTFWRVPRSCPLKEGVFKSAKPAPKKEWVTRSFEDLKYKFDRVHCSQCGGEFGPRDSGFSHCEDHKGLIDLDR